MATVPQPVRRGLRVDYGFLLYFGLHAVGFIATTLLMTWGLLALFFVAIGGFSIDGMMHHLGNLTSRYLAADATRVGQFKLIVGLVQMIIAGFIVFFRRHAILTPYTVRAEHGV